MLIKGGDILKKVLFAVALTFAFFAGAATQELAYDPNTEPGVGGQSVELTY